MTAATSILIRPLDASDRAQWYPLWRGYQQFYRVDIAETVSEVTWRRLLDPAEPMGGAVAVDGSTLVGIVHWIFHRSCWTIGDYCYLQDLFVALDRRGHGIGRQLIEHVYGLARAQGCSRVHWLTHETNSPAMLLYDRIGERSGFVQYRKPLAGNPS
jgi:GNAT superfamily N-acetyltransferase